MECPRCQDGKLSVMRTTHADITNSDGSVIPGITRRRVCNNCGKIFTTTEIIQNVQIYDRRSMKAKYVSPKRFEEIERKLDAQEVLWR